MSNIYTSYVRVYRIDRKAISLKEVDHISRSIIKWHDDFRSYHVPVVIENNSKDNYLDIQYGSGKGLYHLLDFVDKYANVYTIWHRFNDDGNGIDMIERLPYDKSEAAENNRRECTYCFNQIEILNCPDIFIKQTPLRWEKTEDGWKAYIPGLYFSNNGQFGDSGIIDPSRKYDLDRKGDLFGWCSSQAVWKLLESAARVLNSEIRFYYKGRLTTHFSWQKAECFFRPYDEIEGNEFIGFAHDDWDNCADELYLQFHNEHILKKV